MKAPTFCKSFHQNIRALSAWVGAIFFLFNFYGSVAQNNVSFEAAMVGKEAIVGVPFELTFTLKNAEGTRFKPPGLFGFQTSGVSEMRGVSIVNGKSTSTQTWSVYLTNNKPGVFVIEPATVMVDGRKLSSQVFAIRVLPPSESSKGNVNMPPGSDDKIFVAAEFDQKEAFVGQQLNWRVRLYTQLSVEGYDILSLPDFQGFYSKEKVHYDKRIEYITIKRKKYAVRTLHEEALFAQEAGKINIGAARVSVGIEQPGAQGFLFGPKPVTLQTQAIEISIKALPQPLPDEFTGGVGQYTWEFRADTNVLTTDDALTLVVEVKGNGDSRRFAPPKIKVPVNCEIFEPRILEEEEFEGENEMLHRKKFEYVVLPKDTGSMQINPLLSYFNPDSNRYCELRATPLNFTVKAGKNYQSPQILTAPPSIILPKQPGLWEQMLEWMSAPLLWSIVALPLLLLGLLSFLKRRKPGGPVAVPVPVVNAQPPTAQTINHSALNLSIAQQRYNEAGQFLKDQEAHAFYTALFKSIQAWLSGRYGLQTAQMNDFDISQILQQRGATPIRIQALLSVWRTCEQSIYGAQPALDQMESNWQMAGQIMDALEKETR